MAAILIRPWRRRSRLRLVVLQVLMVSLFLTLLGRLWYLQIPTGAEYQARAAEQSVRDVVIQPARGLVVDAMGRPLVANRTSWVVSADRSVLRRLDPDRREETLRRVAADVGTTYQDIAARLVLCGDAGADPVTCWNGSPYQAVPIARGVRQDLAVRIAEQVESYPGIIARTESVRAYPAPYGLNAAGVLGYLSPITGDELDRARAEGDDSLNASSMVGRAGIERTYDEYLRGRPGNERVLVDATGYVIGEQEPTPAEPGNTLVTTLDAELQGFVEDELDRTIRTARQTYDKVTHRNYVADSGAIVVLDAKDASVLAMASTPTYDPAVWVGGISTHELARLYDAKAGNPLVSRATQGQFAPGSTWKPFMAVGALSNGFTPDTRLDCSGGLQVGNRWFKNYESAAYGYIDFARALELSCDTFFYRVGLSYWNRFGSDPADVKAKDPLVEQAKQFGFGSPTGVDIAGEASGRIADRAWKLEYWNAMKDHYCTIDRRNTTGKRDFLHVFAHEFCLEGNEYRAGDAVNFSIGQGDTMVTPLQLARAYVALANGGTLYEPRVAKAVVDPTGKVVKEFASVVDRKVRAKRSALQYVDRALQGTPRTGTLAWRFHGFPLDQIPLRGKTGSAEVHNKQSTSWVATYTKDYVVVMMVTQAGTGSGTSGPAVRRIWERLYGVEDGAVRPRRAIFAAGGPPKSLPTFADDGSILPPVPVRTRDGGADR